MRPIPTTIVLTALLGGCAVGGAPEPASVATVQQADTPPVPRWWMPTRPAGDPMPSATTNRLIVRLGPPAVERAEALYGPPGQTGELRGWWLRPLAPVPTGAWLFLSVSGAIYGVIGPPGLADDPGATALARAGRRWQGILRAAGSGG